MHLRNCILPLASVFCLLPMPMCVQAQAPGHAPDVQYGTPPKRGRRNNYIIVFDLESKRITRRIEYSHPKDPSQPLEFQIYETDIAGVANVYYDTPVYFVVRNINPFRYSVKLTNQPQERHTGGETVFVANVLQLSKTAFGDKQPSALTFQPNVHQVKTIALTTLPSLDDIPEEVRKNPKDPGNAFYNAVVNLLTGARLDKRLIDAANSAVPYNAEALQLNAKAEVEAALDTKPSDPTYQNDNIALNKNYDALFQKFKLAFEPLKDKTEDNDLKVRDYYNQLIGKQATLRDHFANGVKAFTLIQNASSTIAFGPFTSAGDVMKFSLEIRDTNEPADSLPLYQNDNVITVQSHSGWKIDFSPGLAFMRLADRAYAVEQINPSTGQAYTLPNSTTPAVYIRAKNTDDFNTAFAGFLHLYPRHPDWLLQPALTLGIGFRTASQSPTYFAGLSAMVGRERRLVLTGGISFGQVTRLARLQENVLTPSNLVQQIAPPPAGGGNFGDIPTQSVYKNSLFLGLSYNF